MKLFKSSSGGLGEAQVLAELPSELQPFLEGELNPCSTRTESVMGGLSFTVEWLGKTLYYSNFPSFLPDLGEGR